MNVEISNCILKDFDPGNADKFFTMVEANRPRLADFFAGTVAHTRTLQDTRNFCERMKGRILKREYMPFSIWDKDIMEMVGWIDIKNIDWHIPKAEIGYFIDAQHEGKGIISQAVGLVIEEVLKRHKFRKLLCRISANNPGSARVAEKNGFTLEGRIRNDYRTTKGTIIDLLYYGRVF